MLIKYQIRNNFQQDVLSSPNNGITATTGVVSGATNTRLYKSLNIPINLEFLPVDYGDDVQDIVLAEREKAINPIFDAETTKYTFNDITANSGKGLIINFKFWDISANTYSTTYGYEPTGITELDIRKKRNAFKKSYFRLYFFDTNSGETNNLIFTEDLNIEDTTKAIIPFNRLYWLRNDEYFIKNNNNRIIYMEARFFNAKTGKVHRFLNTTSTVPTSITQYKDINNRHWRSSAIILKNPKLNNGIFNFLPNTTGNNGLNSINTITLTEFIMT
jgi:hypothetical protein